MKTLKEKVKSLQSKYSTRFRNIRRRIQVRIGRSLWGRTPTISVVYIPDKNDIAGQKVAHNLLMRSARKGHMIIAIPLIKVEE